MFKNYSKNPPLISNDFSSWDVLCTFHNTIQFELVPSTTQINNARCSVQFRPKFGSGSFDLITFGFRTINAKI